MRPFMALYVGGMGSREKNFYNPLVQRYGFEDAAKEVQDLYLDGKKEEAVAALPDELIDTVFLVRARRTVRERLRAYADAGVGSSSSTRWLDAGGAHRAAAPARRAGGLRSDPTGSAPLGAFGDPGHAFPMIALGRALRARGHDVVLQTWERWRDDVEAEGIAFAARAGVPRLPHAGAAAEALRGRRRGRRGRRSRSCASSRPTRSSPTS